MHIDSLKMFCDLAETESFTKTAQINKVTQSAVSQQISSMERLFKCILIERSKKKFRLTREGELLYEHSKQIIRTAEALTDKLEELRNVISGTLHVATIYSIGLYDLPVRLKKYLKTYPLVNVHVEYRRANQVYDDVLSNVVDIGLVAYPRHDRQLEVVPLFKDEMILICHPEHPLAQAKKVRLVELMGQKFISFEPDIPTGKAIAKMFKTHGVQVQNVMEFDNIETVKRAVEIGAGVSIVPAETVSQEVTNSTVCAVEITGAEMVRPLAAILKRGKVLSLAMKEFINTLKQPTPAEQ